MIERHRAASSWRAPLGLTVTAVTAVLLLLTLWEAYSLGGQAGADIPRLRREQSAVQFQRLLVPIGVDINRVPLVRVKHPALAPALIARIDEEVAAADRYRHLQGAALQVPGQWQTFLTAWSAERRGQRDTAASLMAASALANLFYRLEDASGLEYESNRFAQDLADMLFVKVPNAVNDVLGSQLFVEKAQADRSISIGSRLQLSGLLEAIPSDFDLLGDDWNSVLAMLGEPARASAHDIARYRNDARAFSRAGMQFRSYTRSSVLFRHTPIGSAAETALLSRRAVAQAVSLNGDLTHILNSQLRLRMALERLRNRFIYMTAVLGAALLVGIMLLVAESTALRDRQALREAEQKAERLSTELAREKAERALRFSEAQFHAVFDGAALGIAILDRLGLVLDANVVFRTMYGERTAGVLEGHEEQFAALMRGERDLFEFEQPVVTPAGSEAWTDWTVSLVNDDAGRPYFAICMFRDITELKRNERRIKHDMTHDALTGLPNRALFELRLREQLADGKVSPQSPFAVFYVDLDRFKDINESLGHEAGDFVLSQVAQRLRACIETADVVARLGSDEFAVLLLSLHNVSRVEVVARRVLAMLSKPLTIGARSVFVPASIGIALADADGGVESLMRDADIAMRSAKTSGGARFAVFHAGMHAQAQNRLQLRTDLRLAIDNGEFGMVYQPIVQSADGTLVGCEALLRWYHPTQGLIGPTEFIPLAEQTDLAVLIGRFVLRTVCRQIAEWKAVRDPRARFTVNVNVSATELLHPEFETTLLGAVSDYAVEPSDLILEITEGVILDAGTRPNALVERLRALGFGICIDDFGTGYSSLRYLQQFKVDAIKIDRSFVSGADGNLASEPIVRTLLTLAEALDVRVVAEGVETERQRDWLLSAGCRFCQGYFYAGAVGAEQLIGAYPAAFAPAPAELTEAG